MAGTEDKEMSVPDDFLARGRLLAHRGIEVLIIRRATEEVEFLDACPLGGRATNRDDLDRSSAGRYRREIANFISRLELYRVSDRTDQAIIGVDIDLHVGSAVIRRSSEDEESVFVEQSGKSEFTVGRTFTHRDRRAAVRLDATIGFAGESALEAIDERGRNSRQVDECISFTGRQLRFGFIIGACPFVEHAGKGSEIQRLSFFISPDILDEFRVVDKGVSVMLDRGYPVGPTDLFGADGIGAVPFEEDVNEPGLELQIGVIIHRLSGVER